MRALGPRAPRAGAGSGRREPAWAPPRRAARRALGPAARGRRRAWRAASGGRVYLEAETRAAGRQRRPRGPRGPPCSPPSPGPSAAPAGPALAGLSPRSSGPGWSPTANGGRRVFSGWGPGGGPRDELGFVSGASWLLACKLFKLSAGRRVLSPWPPEVGRAAASPRRSSASGRRSARARSDAAHGGGEGTRGRAASPPPGGAGSPLPAAPLARWGAAEGPLSARAGEAAPGAASGRRVDGVRLPLGGLWLWPTPGLRGGHGASPRSRQHPSYPNPEEFVMS